jgi:hypothetical protein
MGHSASTIRNVSLLVALTIFIAADSASAQRPLTPPPSASKPEELCRIQGRITNALTGEPIRKAIVTFQLLRQNAPNAMQGYTTSSDSEGDFQIENVEPGDYWVSARHDGYQVARYGIVRGPVGPPKLTISPGQQLTSVDVKLLPHAVITGKVTDPDGDPVNGAMAQLLGQTWRGGKAQYVVRGVARTNDVGEYRVTNVPPGKFFLLVYKSPDPREAKGSGAGKPDIGLLTTYFPNAATRDSATPLSVKVGQDVKDINVQMRSGPTFHIRGTVVGPIQNQGKLQVGADLLLSNDSPPLQIIGAQVRQTGDFDIAGLGPGSYRIVLSTADGRARPLGHTHVDVAQSGLNNVQIVITPPVTLRGRITMEGSAPPRTHPVDWKSFRVALNPVEPDSDFIFGKFESASVDDDGTFTIENVPPGKFYVSSGYRPPATYLKSVRIGNQEVTDHVLDVPPAGGELAITFSYNGAEVYGLVPAVQATPGQQQIARGIVYLFPDPLDEYGHDIYTALIQRDGTFRTRSLPPGHYRAIAAERMSYDDVNNAEILAQLSPEIIAFDLNPGEKKHVQLPFVSDNELQQVYLRAGIEPNTN